jgi:beta-lactamase regulating signal transducer with metallopeptidase domain
MQGFLIALLVCSVTMSLLALLYMAVMPFLSKHYSAKGHYYAWLIIVVGLIIPFRPQWTNAVVTITVPNETSAYTVEAGNATFFIPDFVEGMIIPPPTDLAIDSTAISPTVINVSWWQIGFAVWLIGVIIFLVIHAIKHYRFVKMAKRWNEIVTDERTLTVFQTLKNEMGISKKISLYLNSDTGSPIMYGFVKPRIILPTVEPAENELRFILKHELTHYKRKDLCYKFLVLIATAMHWFNPLVYRIARTIDSLCEISCDVEIVRDTDPDTRLQYSETLISVVKYHSRLKTALSTNFYGGKKDMKNRISSIMDTRKKKVGTLLVCLVLALTMGTGIVFAANANGNNTPSIGGTLDTSSIPEGLEAGDIFTLAIHRESNVLPFNTDAEFEAYLADLLSKGATVTEIPILKTHTEIPEGLNAGDIFSIPTNREIVIINGDAELDEWLAANGMTKEWLVLFDSNNQ